MFSKSAYRGSAARSVYFAILVGLTLAAFWAPLSMLVRFSFEREEYSHIILLPLVSTSLFVLERKRIFRHAETHWWAGSGLLVGGILLYWFGERQSSSGWTENNYLFISTCAAVVIWMGIFAFCYGTRAFRAGLFPLLFLLLMVPIPDSFL